VRRARPQLQRELDETFSYTQAGGTPIAVWDDPGSAERKHPACIGIGECGTFEATPSA